MTRSCHSKTNAATDHPVTAALKQLAARQIRVRLVTPEEEPRWNKWVRKHHYLKEHRLVGESLKYVAEQDGQVIAALGWSSAAYHLQPRDRYIGWSAPQRQARRHWVACNARFLLLGPKGRAPNAASQILSRNLECLSQDWQDRYGHPILLVETFVDPQQFQGTCYRAANWTQIGATKGWGRARLDFYQLHEHPKAIFVCELHPKARQLLCAPELPPKLQAMEHANPRQPSLSLRQSKSLLAALDALPDPRRRQGQRHRQVSSILAIAATAMIANNNSFSAIGQFAQALNQQELRSLRASRDRRTGLYLAPSESTIRRTIQGLDPGALDRVVTGWMRAQLADLHLDALAVDGKCARTAAKINGQPLQLFSALDAQSRLVQGQIQIPAKTNEISSLPALLKDLDLRGTLVSADALNTQKVSATYLVKEKKADYLLVVKENQPKLYQKLARLAQNPAGVFFPPDITFSQGHGRHETREVYPFAVTPQQTGFPYAAQAAVIVRTTHHLKSLRVSEETEIVLSSRPADKMDAAQLQALRRGHWAIEAVHHVRDVTFGEDLSTARTGYSPVNLAALRDLVIGLCGLSAARAHQPCSFLPAFRRDAQLHRNTAVALVTRPLLS